MTKKEEKALWYFQEILINDDDIEQWQIIAHYIAKQQHYILKQQKEIEELKTITQAYDSYSIDNDDSFIKDNTFIIANKEYFNNGIFKENFICKDKIREILILYDNAHNELVDLPNGETMCCSDCAELIEYLRELLEEE